MKEEVNHSLYEIFKSKDERFDGRVFIGVSSTGIYCRPVCKAKLPKEENCTYYTTPAEAEADGFRPCLICWPELAPGNSKIDSSKSIAARAVKLLEENVVDGGNIGGGKNRPAGRGMRGPSGWIGENAKNMKNQFINF